MSSSTHAALGAVLPPVKLYHHYLRLTALKIQARGISEVLYTGASVQQPLTEFSRAVEKL